MKEEQENKSRGLESEEKENRKDFRRRRKNRTGHVSRHYWRKEVEGIKSTDVLAREYQGKKAERKCNR